LTFSAALTVNFQVCRDFLQSELNTARNQLFEDFSADDVCPIGSHFIASPSKSHAYNAKMHQKSLEVINLLLAIEEISRARN
jgi:hypothetical protein